MLIQSYTDGICEALFSEFGAAYEIYTEPLEQGLCEPCFSVLTGDVNLSPACCGQVLLRISYTIRFYPSGEDGFADCGAALERMYDALGVIAVGGAFARALDFSGEVNEDGVLEVTLAFERLYRAEPSDGETMQSLVASVSAN